jgi:Flp pilus assembly protein TadB
MNLTMTWTMVALSGLALSIWNRRSAYADHLAARLLRDGEEPKQRGTEKTRVREALNSTRGRAWVVGCLLLGLAGLALQRGFGSRVFLFAGIGVVLGELYHRGRRVGEQKLLTKRLEFFLPTAMERMVMAVAAGLDIIPALAEAARMSTDPVSDVFRKIVALSEGGLRVEQAITLVADEVPSSAVKHALVHLGLAYKQGGEVVRPLKELSDATQTHYQDTVEEEIAKLPVKAVVPLVLTFTGLIICFLTVPIMQVKTSLEKFADVAK